MTGEQLRDQRWAARLPVAAVAARMGVSTNRISLLEKQKAPRKETVERYMAAVEQSKLDRCIQLEIQNDRLEVEIKAAEGMVRRYEEDGERILEKHGAEIAAPIVAIAALYRGVLKSLHWVKDGTPKEEAPGRPREEADRPQDRAF